MPHFHSARYGRWDFIEKDLMRYSLQLAMLKQLLDKQLITDKEYTLIKARLMKDYKVVSDITT